MDNIREIAERIERHDGQTFLTRVETLALAAHVLRSTEPLDRLAHLRDLKPGWDSYGGAVISEKALHAAKSLLSTPGQAVPCSDGGIQVEWHCGGVDVEVCIGPDGKIVEESPDLLGATYDEIRRARCEWCWSGFTQIKMRHLNGGTKGDGDWYPCTAPTPEQVIEEQGRELQRLRSPEPLGDERLQQHLSALRNGLSKDWPGAADAVETELRRLQAELKTAQGRIGGSFIAGAESHFIDIEKERDDLRAQLATAQQHQKESDNRITHQRAELKQIGTELAGLQKRMGTRYEMERQDKACISDLEQALEARGQKVERLTNVIEDMGLACVEKNASEAYHIFYKHCIGDDWSLPAEVQSARTRMAVNNAIARRALATPAAPPAPCPDCDTGYPEARMCRTCKGTSLVAMPAVEHPDTARLDSERLRELGGLISSPRDWYRIESCKTGAGKTYFGVELQKDGRPFNGEGELLSDAISAVIDASRSAE